MEKYINLHLHLDGAITVEIARRLAEIQNMDISNADDSTLSSMLTVGDDCESLTEFLKCFDLPIQLLQTRESISEAVYLVMENERKCGSVYTEIRFAPQQHTMLGLTQEEAVLAAVEGLKRASIKGNIILCCMRGTDTEEKNLETVRVAKRLLVSHGGVTAVDIAGAEALFPTKDYRELFDEIRSIGLPYTIHAGEADGADSVRAAIEFGTKRIGHGVRMFEDESLIDIVIEKGIFLEMCPTSNKITKAIDNMENYPLVDFLNRGVLVTVNTDDPGIEGTSINREYDYLEREFGFTAQHRKKVLNNAVNAAFTTDEVKKALLEELFG